MTRTMVTRAMVTRAMVTGAIVTRAMVILPEPPRRVDTALGIVWE